MKRLILIGCFFLTARAFAVTDPLSSQFMPTINAPSEFIVGFGSITVTTTSYKVFQSSPAPGNITYAFPYQFQNEMRGFQIHATPSVNISSYTVTVGSLTNVQTNTTISTTTTDITVYREWYINVATPTCLSTVTYSGGIRTYMPAILIPSRDPYYNQLTNAFPVAITAGNTQSVWVDVHIPSSAPSGYYAGNALVSSGTVVVSTIPIVIGVWSWVMPSTATLGMIGAAFTYNGFNNVAFGQTVSGCYYPGANGGCDGANFYEWIDGATQMLDNKWGIDLPAYNYPNAGSFTQYVSSMSPLFNGTAGNATTTILPGAALTITGIQFTGNASAAIWQNWASTFTAQGWFSKLHSYFCDEASGSALDMCISSMTTSRSWSTPIIPNQTTIKMENALAHNGTNYIDWMTPILEDLYDVTAGDSRTAYNVWLATTGPYNVPRRIGSYIDCESAGTCGQGTIGPANAAAYPNQHIDGTAVANRAFQTAAFKETISYQLHYDVDECDHSFGYPCAGSVPDPWHVLYAFGNQGPGTFMVPSTSTIVLNSTGTTLAVPIWCPTLTLKEHSKGMNDFEIENYLTNVGSGTYVQNQIATWYTNPFTFSNDPSKIEAARVAMGTAIHQLTYPAGGGPAAANGKAWSGGFMLKGGGTFQ